MPNAHSILVIKFWPMHNLGRLMFYSASQISVQTIFIVKSGKFCFEIPQISSSPEASDELDMDLHRNVQEVFATKEVNTKLFCHLCTAVSAFLKANHAFV